MAGSIVDRLNRMKSLGAAPGIATKVDRSARVLDLPGWERVGEFCYLRSVEAPCDLPTTMDSRLLSAPGIETQRLCFFDTETTGLSSGAGSVAFLFGTGRLSDRGLAIRQVFLADYPGEPEFLAQVAREMADDPVLVSYNGSSFDLPMLRSRFAMNSIGLQTTDHLDLLHVTRRFWQRALDSCTLSTIESEVLDAPRIGDIPGAEVPEIYFHYLRSGDSSALEPVFEHHRLDILTLARLFAHCEQVLEDPTVADVDHARVGSWLLSIGDERGISVLEHAFRGGDTKAGLDLAVAYRRRTLLSRAREIWQEIWESTHHLEAGVELAKQYEHRERRYDAALELIERMLTDPRSSSLPAGHPESRESLAHRKSRILRKLCASVPLEDG